MNRSIALASCVILSACATAPVNTATAEPVPVSRIVEQRMLASAGSRNLIVKRDAGVFERACAIRFFFDGAPVGDLRTSEKLELHLPTGGHVLSGGAGPADIICGGGVSETTVVIGALKAQSSIASNSTRRATFNCSRPRSSPKPLHA